MPFYQTTVRPNLTTEDQRRQFAAAVVEVHCDVTGAPPSFVHALVVDDPGSRLETNEAASIHGVIRAGRTDAQKAEIVERLRTALAEIVNLPVDQISASTRDIEASFTMEGGVLLPEPGSPEEAAWGQVAAT